MDLETIGVNAVSTSIAKTDRLQPFINKKDKEPVWDGYVYIHEDNNHTKKNIKRVYVQVKCETCKYNTPKDTISYPIDKKDLQGFLNNGGAIFFVACVNEDSGDLLDIYYIDLQPVIIRDILKTKPNTESPSCKLIPFPKEKYEKVDVFLNAHMNNQRQSSFANTNLPSIEEYKEKGILKGLYAPYLSSNKDLTQENIIQTLDEKGVCLYADIEGSSIPVPITYVKNLSKLIVTEETCGLIFVNGTKYYDTAKLTSTSSEQILTIGKSVVIKQQNIMDETKTTTGMFNVNVVGTLTERMHSLKFIVDMLENKSFEIDGEKVSFEVANETIEKLLSQYKTLYDECALFKKVLNKLNVEKELDVDNCTMEDFCKLDMLVDAIEYGKPTSNLAKNLPSVIRLIISNLRLAIIVIPCDEGYRIYDFFGTILNLEAKDSDGNCLHVSQFDKLDCNGLVYFDNVNTKTIVDDYKRIKPYEYIINSANNLLLEMIKAYDIAPSESLYQSMLEFSEWLMTQEKFLIPEISYLNYLQIIKRKRNLNYQEKKKLFEIIDTSDEVYIKIGAFILIDEPDEAKKMLETLKPEEVERFKEFPIYKLLTLAVEEDNHNY